MCMYMYIYMKDDLTGNVHALVFNAEDVQAFPFGGHLDEIMEVLLVHDLTQLRHAVGICDGSLHVEGVGSWWVGHQPISFINLNDVNVLFVH